MVKEMLTKEVRYKLTRHFKKQAPLRPGSGQRVSRRYPDQFSHDAEEQSFRAVMIYIQKGLGEHKLLFNELIKRIMYFQQDQSASEYPICLFSFGWKADELQHLGKAIWIKTKMEPVRITDQLCELSGIDNSDVYPVIPQVFPKTDPFIRIRTLTKDDLSVFICRNQEIQMSSSIKGIYSKALIKRSIWLFVQEDKFDIHFGTFIPAFEKSTE